MLTFISLSISYNFIKYQEHQFPLSTIQFHVYNFMTLKPSDHCPDQAIQWV